MIRIWLGLAVSVAIAGSLASSAAAAVPALSEPRARDELNQVLRQDFRTSYTFGDGKHRECRRASRILFRCKVSWFIGDGTFHGRVRVWRNRTTSVVHARYVIRAVDQYCRYVTRDRPCAETHVGRS